MKTMFPFFTHSEVKLQKLCKKIQFVFLNLLTITFSLCHFNAFTQSDSIDQALIYTFEIKEMIAPAAARTAKKAIAEAEKQNADFIIMELNTYGGLVDAADSIRTSLLQTTIPTVSYINNNAASAGALISIACDSIYMSTGANIGASTVVTGQGEEAPDKYQSYMRATMRSTAEAQGRDPKIAEAMVDQRLEIEGVVKEGEVITFTTSEAIANGYCEGQAESLQEVIQQQLQLQDYTIVHHKKDFADKVISFLLNPVVSSVLMFMMIGGIWFEIQTPGVGFPLAAAIIGAVLYFMPLYLEGLAENWEIALFVVGILLLAAEVFVIPGFGVAGILGGIAILISLTFSLIDNTNFDWSPEGLNLITFPLIRVFSTLIVLFILTLVLTPILFKHSNFRKLVLETATDKERGYTVEEKGLRDLIGLEGVVINELRPIGRIEIAGEYYYARSISEWLESGQKVKVIQVDVNNLVVRKADA